MTVPESEAEKNARHAAAWLAAQQADAENAEGEASNVLLEMRGKLPEENGDDTDTESGAG